MARNLNEVKDPEKAKRGSQQTFTEADVNNVAVLSDTYRDILRRVSTESAKFYLGHGMRSRDDPNLGYMYAELLADGTGTGVDGDAIDGTFRFVVYADSEDEVPIVGPQQDSRDMREAVTDARTERPALPLMLPGAGKDKAIAVQFKSTDASDGAVIANDSNVLIPYSSILQ